MANKIDWADLHVTREQYDQTLRDSVNQFYEHQMNDPNVSQEEAIESTSQMAESYHNAMDEFDSNLEAAEAQANEGIDGGTDGGMDGGDGGMGM